MRTQERKQTKPGTSEGGGAEGAELERDDAGGDDQAGGDDGAGAVDWRTASDDDRVAEITRLLQVGDDDADDETPNNDDGAGGGAGDDDADGDEPAAGDEGEAPSKRAPKNLEALAEALELEAKDLYAVKVPIGEGKSRTLGELKDLAKGTDDLETREHEFSERRVTTENELLRARQDLDFVVARLPKGTLTKDVLERAHAERTRIVKREQARTLESIPAWNDPEVRETELTAMGEFMQTYGFDAADIDRITDHRMFKMVRDSWQRFARVQKALAKVEEKRKGKNTTGKAPAKKGASESNERKAAPVDWRQPKKRLAIVPRK